MSDAVTISLIGMCGTFLNAVLILLNNIITRRNAKSIKTLEQHTNSIKDALVAATAKASFAEGKAEGTETERRRSEDNESGRSI